MHRICITEPVFPWNNIMAEANNSDLSERMRPWRRYEPENKRPIESSVDSAVTTVEINSLNTSSNWGDDDTQRKRLSGSFDPLVFGHEDVGDLKRSRLHPSWWLPEILALAGGTVCLLGIVVLLWRADGNPPQELRHGITLNTVLAFLTSLVKAAFMVPIVEGLSQLKWTWFLSPRYRPLADIQVFDQATRGGLGGFKLLYGLKGFLPSFGSIIMLSGLFTSTLTQQAVTYPLFEAVATKSNESATVDRATSFSTYDGNDLKIRPYDTTREAHALFQGALSVPTEAARHITPFCSSAKCNWDLYGSLAICADVVNLTALNDQALLNELRAKTGMRIEPLFNSSLVTAIAMGYGDHYFESVPAVLPIVIDMLDAPTGAFNQSVVDLMSGNTYLAYSDDLMENDKTISADLSKLKFLEIGLWWCTKTYKTRVEGGQHMTKEMGARSELVEPSNTLNVRWASDFYPCYTTGTCNETYGGLEAHLHAPPHVNKQEKFSVHVWTALTASALLSASIFDSAFLDRHRGVISSNGGGIAKSYALAVYGDFLTTEMPSPEDQMRNVRAIARNSAQTLTNLVREGATRHGKGSNPSEAMARGVVIVPQAIVKVQWAWLSLLAAQLVLAIIFLVMTIYDTHKKRVQVIKSSSLATVCALDTATRRHVGNITDLETLNEKAKVLGVQLDRGGSGVALWLRMKKPSPETCRPDTGSAKK